MYAIRRNLSLSSIPNVKLHVFNRQTKQIYNHDVLRKPLHCARLFLFLWFRSVKTMRVNKHPSLSTAIYFH